MMTEGNVVSIHLASGATEQMRGVGEARAVALGALRLQCLIATVVSGPSLLTTPIRGVRTPVDPGLRTPEPYASRLSRTARGP